MSLLYLSYSGELKKYNALIISDKYIQIEIKTESVEQKEILIARLSELGYQFEEERFLLKAFISSDEFNQNRLDEIFDNKIINYSLSILPIKNWNAEWEAGFQPVAIGSFCRIRAKFHPAEPGFEHEIIITPQMSFGTGHHATTYMMVEAMRKIDINRLTVFDFGTGTGILAILAHKLGAASIEAIDNDEWSIENAKENFKENNAENIHLTNAEGIITKNKFEVILANVNKNVILKNLAAIKQHLSPGGVVLLSGLLEDDRKIILEAMDKESFTLLFDLERDSWICLAIVLK